MPETNSEPEIVVAAEAGELIEIAAQRLAQIAEHSIAERGCFHWSLAGGNTPRALYRLLASEPWRAQIDWESTFVWFGDERAVPPDDERSNYRMACETLFEHVDIPPENIYRMRGEDDDLNAAARDYGLQLKALDAPLDLALLGMGDDGHTASLFPHTPALHETRHRCVAVDVAPLEPHVPRLTLTFPVFNAARKVWILATGASKAARVAKVLFGPRDVAAQPVQGIAPATGKLAWLLDAAAATEIQTELRKAP